MNTEILWRLRLRTPRLELRLPTEEELDELYAVAEAGIHPPEEMPFGVAWTDDLQHNMFVEFHRTAWREWAPERWTCNLVTFCEGRAIGTQAISAEDFEGRHEVTTAHGSELRFKAAATERSSEGPCSSSRSEGWAHSRPRAALSCPTSHRSACPKSWAIRSPG